ncbi:patatin-like phospholipase family protein [Roseomonas sp. AR75]|uniref:patatin-like phospholipase family protein n=1 Tax=Roseomonas sp. AR75 TaxID=2562311 RepID=UPI0010C0B631|nr:patatin-like phospholipase family protein [Roseomonas sp. AR75]
MPIRSAHPTASGRRRLLRGAAAGALAAGLPGCALPVREPPVPRYLTGTARVLGVPNERFRPDQPNGFEAFDAEASAALRRQAARRGIARTSDLSGLNLLAISGGGENGAFGAGLLNGWTAHGNRPVFDLVTGVSTGALTAPFAFLGSAWDEKLKSVYTDITPERVAIRRWFTAALFDDALADTAPLFAMISEYLDDAMIAAIAEAYDEGRLLMVASTDIDAQVPVIWNIGAIAKSGHPRALDTVRRILLASAAIPGAFPPVLFDTEVDGVRHQEMHVDGGAFAQAFLYPAAATRARRDALANNRRVTPATAWIIRNGRIDPEWADTTRRTVSIAGRAVSTMIAASGYNDVVRMYFAAQRDGIDFNLAYIGRDFTAEYTVPFEQAYMRALYEYGFERARRGFDWTLIPPGAA